MIYLWEHTDLLTQDFVEASGAYLSRQRKEKTEQYSSLRHKINSCAVYLLLRYGLWWEYGIREAPVFMIGAHDKPFLSSSGIHFNLSHCKNAVCCILSHENTAIDITDFRPFHPSVLRRVCSPAEQEMIRSSQKPQMDFLRLWTRKECYAKLKGEGLSMNFCRITDDIPEVAAIRTFQMEQFFCSYYTKEKDPERLFPTQEEILAVMRQLD